VIDSLGRLHRVSGVHLGIDPSGELRNQHREPLDGSLLRLPPTVPLSKVITKSVKQEGTKPATFTVRFVHQIPPENHLNEEVLYDVGGLGVLIAARPYIAVHR
jgi:hypothetical protein